MEKYIIFAIVLMVILALCFAIYAATTDKIIKDLTLDKERLEKENSYFRRELSYKRAKALAYDTLNNRCYQAIKTVERFIVEAEQDRDNGARLQENLRAEFAWTLGKELIKYATIKRDDQYTTGQNIAYRLTFDFWCKANKEEDNVF